MFHKRFLAIFIIAFLLFSGQVAAQQRTINKVDFDRIEAYLNEILDFHEETLKKVIKNLPKDKRDWYAPLHKDYKVILRPNMVPCACVDLTKTELVEESQKYIYISVGYLWTEIEDGTIIKWELKSEAELAGTLAHELIHLVSTDRDMDYVTDKKYIIHEVMTDALAIGLLLEEGYRPLAHADKLKRYLETWYDKFELEQTRPKEVFEKRIQLVEEMILEAMAKFPSNEYKEFLIATPEEFEQIKELIRDGQ